MESDSADAPVRTVLKQKIRERRLTYDEFVEYAEVFAREHGEPGTLSRRHLQRLASGAHPDGRPLGTVRPATARLLERIFGISIGELLSPPRDSLDAAQPLRVALAIVVRDSDVLLVYRRDDAGGISWQFPAGVVKPGGSSRKAAVRETLDETGVHCVASRPLGSRLHPVTKVICDYVLCDYVTGDARNIDVAENVDVVWVGKDELPRFIPVDQIYAPVLEALELEREPSL